MRKLAVLNSFLVALLLFRGLNFLAQIAKSVSLPPIDADSSTYWIYDGAGLFLRFFGIPISIFLASVIGLLAMHVLQKRSGFINWFIFAIILIIICSPFQVVVKRTCIELPADPNITEKPRARIIKEIDPENLPDLDQTYPFSYSKDKEGNWKEDPRK